MTLDWKDCRYRSIADSPCGRWTLSVYMLGSMYEWSAIDGGVSDYVGVAMATRKNAKAAAEKWLSEQPAPEPSPAPQPERASMALDWKRTRTHSIAETDNRSVVSTLCTDGMWNTVVYPSGKSLDRCPDRAKAEQAAEAYLDSLDKPEWHVTELAACATWREWGMVVSPSIGCSTFCGEALTRGGYCEKRVFRDTLKEAMSAIEAEVRKATAKETA